MGIGLVSAVSGLLFSHEIDTQPGPTIVLIALAIFILTAVIRGILHARAPEEAPHG